MSALHASHHQRCVQSVLTCVALLGRVQLFPNWVVRYVRNPNLRLKSWMGVPVEVFIVPPAMSKFEIAEYLKRLYNLPILKVHTANYLGQMKRNANGQKYKLPDFKKAYVYLQGTGGATKEGLRYQPIVEQQTDEALAAWPARPGQGYSEIEGRFPIRAKKDAKR